MIRGVVVVVAVVAVLLGARVMPAGAEDPCDETSRPAVRTTLYFGRSTASREVSDAQWAAFLRDAVTPRFPQGLTAWDAQGQWRTANGATVGERAKVLALVHDGTAASQAGISRIVEEYKARFAQESVLRETARICVSF